MGVGRREKKGKKTAKKIWKGYGGREKREEMGKKRREKKHKRRYGRDRDKGIRESRYTVKTPDADFRTYNRMPQDQTVHGAENVSCLWTA